MRPTRKQLKFDEESVNKLLQECYNDSHNTKAKITRLFTKWETKVKESGEIQIIGDQIVKLILAESKIQDQKIMLLRYLKEVVFDNKVGEFNNNKSGREEEKGEVTTDRRKELIKFVADEVEKKEKNNNI
jgi:transcriptional regulator NrdR family protein